MGALAIVEAFNVIKDLSARLGAGSEIVAVNEFQFEGAPEAFHGGVVITVAFATHRGNQAGLAQRTAGARHALATCCLSVCNQFLKIGGLTGRQHVAEFSGLFGTGL